MKTLLLSMLLLAFGCAHRPAVATAEGPARHGRLRGAFRAGFDTFGKAQAESRRTQAQEHLKRSLWNLSQSQDGVDTALRQLKSHTP